MIKVTIKSATARCVIIKLILLFLWRDLNRVMKTVRLPTAATTNNTQYTITTVRDVWVKRRCAGRVSLTTDSTIDWFAQGNVRTFGGLGVKNNWFGKLQFNSESRSNESLQEIVCFSTGTIGDRVSAIVDITMLVHSTFIPFYNTYTSALCSQRAFTLMGNIYLFSSYLNVMLSFQTRRCFRMFKITLAVNDKYRYWCNKSWYLSHWKL